MGNSPSKPISSVPSSNTAGTQDQPTSSHSRKEPKRRDSVQAGSYSRPSHVPASDSVTSAPAPTRRATSRKSNHHQHLQDSEESPTQLHIEDSKMGNDQSRQKWKEKLGTEHSVKKQEKAPENEGRKKTKEQSIPVRVPTSQHAGRQKGPDSQFQPSGPPRDLDYVPHSNLNFPPRLPLPIEEELYTPGSPIITSADLESSALQEDEVDGAILRPSSVLSSTTADEDDVGDDLQPLEGSRRTVPTRVEWHQGGERVYITGTFTGWSRKFRMHRDPTGNGLFAILELPPGTHHVKFIVDGDMQLSNELPTAVDFTNILVNYIEVSADDLPKEKPEEYKVPEGVYPPQVLPPGIDFKDHAPDSVGKTQPKQNVEDIPPMYFGSGVPGYLIDMDRHEDSKRYDRAVKGTSEMPTPPSLPLFLTKSILNGTTPMKDDSSVLNMPNHTVLNHLATSSIKNGVLATSATTRYKRKYVTTIMYRPTTEDGS